MTRQLRNIAIIAHVDHGKTTLIDSMMKQSGMFRDNQKVETCVMDSGDLEKERGITILAKPTSIKWTKGDDTVRINIIDTPGHADFGGEVERVLHMADGVILLTDAAEGPLPQTKFVLGKALKQGLRPIVIINKIDRADARPEDVLNEVFDLFVSLDATDDQLDFPVLYASGRDGWCVRDLSEQRENLSPLLDLILDHVPPPQGDADAPFAMLATLLDSDPYLGRCLTGRVIQGSAKVNDTVRALNLAGETVENGRLTKLLKFEGTARVPVGGPGRGRRHYLYCRADRSLGCRYDRRAVARQAGGSDANRPADDGGDDLGQRFAVCRQGGQQGHLNDAARPAAGRSRNQCRDHLQRKRGQGFI